MQSSKVNIHIKSTVLEANSYYMYGPWSFDMYRTNFNIILHIQWLSRYSY